MVHVGKFLLCRGFLSFIELKMEIIRFKDLKFRYICTQLSPNMGHFQNGKWWK